ncbi:MAG: KilA-N domain-containing protein [Vicingaceae bacterium]|jgi:KilA domain-containing protein|nr:KilA-N domain-containing protein [Flavobacteriales bacterium]MBQ19705.1 DNA-binding protein [Flavobacteriales bacterium]MDF1675557.1 KilA-N domain-containing protein [Vicingaceae bacterium]|tara:strand:- start:42417 stop:43241 length:825 start_codon:yes stop_codon:yes gene_type:complete
MAKNKKIEVKGREISLYSDKANDYISLTDMARYRDADRTNYIIQNWMRTRSAIEFCGLWEQLKNPNFKRIEFDAFKNESGSNSFTLTPQKWIQATNAIGIISKSGRYGGTFAHRDIAFEFATWISAEFKFYLINEFQRLKEEESSRQNLEWNYQRHLTKVNYHIHTDAIKEILMPENLSKQQISFVYANEADVLNMALFGKTAKQWRDENPNEKGNIRDTANIEQLVVLSNLESLNAVLINQGIKQPNRLQQLNEVAIAQMTSLLNHKSTKKLI